MKKIALVTAAVLMIVALCGSAFAANSLQQGKFGISVGFNNLSSFPNGMEDTIIARYFATGDMALIAGFGYTKSSGDSATGDGTDLSLAFGLRKYLKKDDFAPFAEGIIVYLSQDSTERNTMGVLANMGAEYFLHKQFSLEGSVGIGLMRVETNTGPSASSNILGTTSLGVRANLYF